MVLFFELLYSIYFRILETPCLSLTISFVTTDKFIFFEFTNVYAILKNLNFILNRFQKNSQQK